MTEELVITAAMIPDDVQARLQAAGKRGDDASFEIGELTNLISADLEAETHGRWSKMSLYAAIGTWAGCAAETVRMRAHVERHVPKWVSNKYDELFFHQWKALVPHVPEVTDWAPTLEAWFEHCAQSGGRLSSVDGIRSWLSGKGKDAALLARGRWRRFMRLAERLEQDDAVPVSLRATVSQLLKAVFRVSEPAWAVEE